MTDLRGKTILVIGGAGFIGSHVCDQLLKDDVKQVIVYDNFCRGTAENLAGALRDPRLRIFEVGGDILHPDFLDAAMKESNLVVHLAALWLLQCHDYPRSVYEVYFRGTFNVLEACRNRAIERLVYSSSASVYGDAVETPMTEEHPFNNRTFYGATKIAGEAMARAFFTRYGVNYAGLRYMNAYGPRQDYKGVYVTVIMKMMDRLDEDLPPVVYGDGSQAYDFVYVEDVARANVLALKATATDQFYNIGTGQKTTVKEIAELVLKLTGSKHALQYNPEGTTFVTQRVGSTAKAARDLQFRAQIPLEEGLKRLIEWRRDHQDRHAGARRARHG